MVRRRNRLIAGLVSGLLTLAVSLSAAGVPLSECFPLERLDPSLRPEAEQLLLKALDSEALFTIVGGLKPISSSWVTAKINVDAPDWRESERIRRIVQTFRCGQELSATIQPFWRVYGTDRSLDGFFLHHGAVARTVAAHPETFAFFGVSPASDPIQVLMAFEVDATPRRNRAYGYLFGYPRHAVDFFVESEALSRRTGKFVERDFFNIPVFERPTNRFVYAVPKGHTANAEDLALRDGAAAILADYRARRANYIGPGKRGVVALIRDWFDDGKGHCSPDTALRKVRGLATQR